MKLRNTFSKAVIGAAIALVLSGCDTDQTVSSVPVNKDTVSPAKAVLTRVTGNDLPTMTTELVTDNQPDWYQITVSEGQLDVRGNSTSAITYGAYQYLEQQGALSVSWEGKRVALPQSFPDFVGEKITSQFDQRAYLNVCAYGYTTPWWTWERWEQEIDWMALHGVNNPVAMEGQEYIWQQLWNEMGVSDAQLADYFSGPAFTPWQRMGNIEGHEGPLPQSWINKKHQLQKQILSRMDELGMEPVVPAFAGYVPKSFAQKHPEAKIYTMPTWSGFDNETYWLDPADPLFPKLAKRFIELYTQAYGEHKYYLSDAFNEMLPPVSEQNREQDLARYGKRLYDSIKQVAPDAVWVMQGWMFGADEEFWDIASIEAFLQDVPDNKAMIHDIGNDRYHVWQRTEGFKGKSWVFGFIHNYGGSDPVYADFADYVEQLDVVTSSKNAGNLTGFGVFPEGIHNNSVAYEFLFDLPWNNSPDMQTWLSTYTKARYGKTSPALLDAWDKLIDGVFSVRYWKTRWWEGSAGAYLLFKRPTINVDSFPGNPGDLGALDKGLAALIAMAPEYRDSPLFVYDVVDLTKHSVSLHVDMMLLNAVNLYKAGDVEQGNNVLARVGDIVGKLDLLMGYHQDTLHSWLSEAAAYGETAEESAYYIKNARKQITQWGGNSLKDYASKAWQGMYANYYLPRWKQYLEAYQQAKQQGKGFDDEAQQQRLIQWESEWIAQSTIPEKQQPKNPIELANTLLKAVSE